MLGNFLDYVVMQVEIYYVLRMLSWIVPIGAPRPGMGAHDLLSQL